MGYFFSGVIFLVFIGFFIYRRLILYEFYMVDIINFYFIYVKIGLLERSNKCI